MTAGVILAAGISSRMGGFKPLLPIGDTTFIRRLIGQMKAVAIRDIVVVTGYRHKELEEAVKDDGVICVYNSRFFDSQMLDSVKLGISAVMQLGPDYDRILLSPSDVVMSPQWIFEEIMIGNADFVRPIYKEEPGHPVLIKSSLYDYILTYDGERGLRGAVEFSGMKIKNLQVDEPNILLDADTKEDYIKALAEYDLLMGQQGRLHGNVDVELVAGEPVCSEKFMKLLELVEATGSLQNAAKAMKLSYTTVWKSIRDVEKKCSNKLIAAKIGGADGGSSCLTEHGRDMLIRYKKMRSEMDASVRKIFDDNFGDFRL